MVVVAAGVLPYNRKYGFLLGRETSDGSFSSFSGGREKEETPLGCAAREFYEESMGLIMDENDARVALKDAIFFQHDISPGKQFRLYILEIPFCPYLVSEFKKRYAQLLQRRVDHSFLEMDEAIWVSDMKMLLKGKSKLKLRPEFVKTMKMIYSY